MTRTRVAVDLSQLAPGGENGGAARFVLDLLEFLGREGDLDLVLLVRDSAAGGLARLRALGSQVVPLGLPGAPSEPRRFRRAIRRLPPPLCSLVPDGSSLRRLGADLLFSPLQSAAFHEPGIPHVAVAYDAQELHYPQFFTKAELCRRAAFRADLRRCTAVVAISETTRRDLVEHARLRPELVTVIHPAGPSERKPLPDDVLDTRLARLSLERDSFALYPANFWPHKNHSALLHALATAPLREEHGFRLVLSGALDDQRRGIGEIAADLALAAHVRVLGYQADEDVTALLQGARVMVFPSLFEGFGIPVVEAFRLGVAVSCSDIPALREIAGDAALFFDPTDESSIGLALSRLWTDGALRAELVRSGRARASAFPASSVAGRWAATLRDAAQSRSPSRRQVRERD